MKNKFILSTLFSLALIPVMAQNPVTQPDQVPQAIVAPNATPEIVQFKEIVYDFGNIKQNVPVTHVFEFKNIGSKDITLVNVQASCGCTTPNWKGGVYTPQTGGEIKATYNAASEGFFNKVVTVTTSEGVIVLTIKGTVLNAAAYDEWTAKVAAEKLQKEKEAYEKMTKKEKKAYDKKKKKEKKAQEKQEKAKKKAEANKPKEESK